jgi:PAS domain-containing protein
MTPPEFEHVGSLAELKETAANSVPFEKEYIRKDGSRVPVLAARATFNEVHGDGVACVIDITDRKRAEQVLLESEANRKVTEAIMVERQLFLGMLETLPIMICLMTPDYRVAFVNRNYL